MIFKKIQLYFYTLKDLKISQFLFHLKFIFIKPKFLNKEWTNKKIFYKKKEEFNFIEDVNDYKKVNFYKKFKLLIKIENQNNKLKKFNLYYLNHIYFQI